MTGRHAARRASWRYRWANLGRLLAAEVADPTSSVLGRAAWRLEGRTQPLLRSVRELLERLAVGIDDRWGTR